MRLASGTFAVVIAAARSPRSTVHHYVTSYDRGSALPEDDEPFLSQDS
jgi:hypothetical protein